SFIIKHPLGALAPGAPGSAEHRSPLLTYLSPTGPHAIRLACSPADTSRPGLLGIRAHRPRGAASPTDTERVGAPSGSALEHRANLTRRAESRQLSLLLKLTVTKNHSLQEWKK